MAYIGSTPTSQNFIAGTDYFNGTGSQTAFTLTRSVNSVNDIELVINNVIQQPNSYTVSGTTLTISAAPSSGTSNVYVRYLSTTLQSITIPNNSINFSKLDTDLQAEIQGRNRIINGAMLVSQRYGTTSTSGIAGNNYYIDQFMVYVNGGATYTVQQSSTAPVGFTKSMLFTTSSGTASGTNSRAQIQHNIEGLNCGDLNWGTANAKTVTLSFWVQSSKTGQFGGSLQNPAGTQSYPFTYTISTANTWQQVSVTITGSTTGVWTTDNSLGIQVMFDIGMGTGLQTTAGAWAAGDYRGATGDTSIVATSGATWYITGVQLEEGTTATSFEREIYSVTLQKCQRYFYRKTSDTVTDALVIPAPYNLTATNAWAAWWHPVTMRAIPTYSNGANFAGGSPATVNPGIRHLIMQFTNGTWYIQGTTTFDVSAEL